MQIIPLSEFQPNCTAILESLSHSNQSILISQPGQWIVKITPLSSSKRPEWLGCMSETGKILGDIVSPLEEESAQHWSNH
jgi:hypothetical protein